MTKRIILAAVLLLACVIIYNRQFNGPRAIPSLGVYAYECENGSDFKMEPANNLMSIELIPTGNSDFQKDNTLMKVATANGALYQGNGITFKALGEKVSLQTSATTTTCSPKQVEGEAPFNFGD
jgi:hypothetical protein